MQDQDDRRHHQRTEHEVFATVTVRSLPAAPLLEQKIFRCLTQDLSASGLQILTFEAPPVDAVVEIDVALVHPAKAFRHFGRVAWTREIPEQGEYAIGIEFTETDRDVLEAWGTAVKHMMDEGQRQ